MSEHEPDRHPFRLGGQIRFTGMAALDRHLESLLESILGLTEWDRLYQQIPAYENGDQLAFLARVLAVLNITSDIDDGEVKHIPRQGPVIVVANHPFGALEGIVIAHLLKRLRSDVRIMANEVVQRLQVLHGSFFEVDPFGGPDAVRRNIRPLREAIRWLSNGGLLVVFPAGEISSLNIGERRIADPQWSPTLARLVRKSQVSVLPLYVHGRNSWLFQLLGLIHPRLRTALIPRELLNKRNGVVSIRIGKPVPFSELRQKDDRAMVEYLRLRTYMLAEWAGSSIPKKAAICSAAEYEPLINPPAAELLAREVEALPPEQCLVTSGELRVLYAHAAQIPLLLREIGRLREMTFRDTGEGTGKSLDLDIHDNIYRHLFVWNADTQELVSAYRFGLADEIADTYGIKGLYTHHLFRYRHALLQQMGPAIEMGRSFVRQEYQRRFSPLMLLWKGIFLFMARNPPYRILFGAVSISNEYDTMSRQLLVDFLRYNKFDADLAKLIRPRIPYKRVRRRSWRPDDMTAIDNIESVSDIISQLEDDKKGAPVLLRQYLKLGGKILGFNVDPEFNNALDGLIMVDLAKTEVRFLQKYMGKETARTFLEFHRVKQERAHDQVS